VSETEAEPDAAAVETAGESPEDLDERAELLSQLDAVTAERDDYLDQLQRQRAEFQNYRKRVEAERRRQVSAGVSRLVESLLPVLDGCDAATSQGHSEVAAVGQSLLVALGKAGLERIDSVGAPFDPTQHEAVTIEVAPAADPVLDGDADAPDGEEAASEAAAQSDADAPDPADGARQVVTAELRSGFRFDGRVLRAAMVKVRAE
jgi:molecular chaperone GrpE (heat shock protein)